MTVSTSDSKVEYTGNGVTTIFDYAFPILDESHAKLYLGEDLQTSGFVISGIGDPSGGSVTYDVAPDADVLVTILREVPLTQEIDYNAYDPFPAETHESGLDLGVMRSQQIDERVQRAIVQEVGAECVDFRGLCAENILSLSTETLILAGEQVTDFKKTTGSEPLNGGVWAADIEFTQYNQYMVFSGVAYKPRHTTILPYTSEVVPNASNVEPFSDVTSGTVGYLTPIEYSTVADLAAGNPVTLLPDQVCRISERSHALWIGAGGGAANTFDILDAGGGNTAELQDKTQIEFFGGKGDGTHDNGPLFTFLEDSGHKVQFSSGLVYKTTASFNLLNATEFHGNESTILCEHSLIIGTIGTDCYLGGFVIDGNNADHTSIPFRLNSPSSNVRLGRLEWRDFHGQTAFQTYPVYLPMYGASNFQIDDQRFINITQDDDGAVTGKGFVGGLYLVGLDAEVANGQSFGKVGNIYGDNIKSVDSGAGVVQDSDLVRMFAETNSTEKFDITFGNVEGRNVGKRLVKGASCGGIAFGDITSFVEVGGLVMHAAVEVLQSGFDMTFGDIKNEGPNTRVVWFQGCSGCTAGNIYNGWGSIAATFGGAGATATECQVGEITGRKREGVENGSGAYFFNADGCSTGNIVGNFEWSVRCSSAENIGVNTVGDVDAIAKMDLTYGETHIGNFALDMTKLTFNAPYMVLGDRFILTESVVKTKGNRSVNIVGAIDGDMGDFRITRSSSSGGMATDITVITTEGGGVSGGLRGSIYVEVQNAIAGTPVVTPKQTLIYLDGLNKLDLDRLHLNITTPTRGAVGYNLHVDNCSGYIGNLLLRAQYLATSVVDGNVTLDKAVNFCDAASTLNLTTNVILFQAEKRAGSAINGAINTPVVVDSTRP